MKKLTKIILKQDKYREDRGGHSRLMEIQCAKCRGMICLYQKDSSGPLKRLYVDRILGRKITWKNNAKFMCKKCKDLLGLASIYKTENRKCFILFQDVITKKIVKV